MLALGDEAASKTTLRIFRDRLGFDASFETGKRAPGGRQEASFGPASKTNDSGTKKLESMVGRRFAFRCTFFLFILLGSGILFLTFFLSKNYAMAGVAERQAARIILLTYFILFSPQLPLMIGFHLVLSSAVLPLSSQVSLVTTAINRPRRKWLSE